MLNKDSINVKIDFSIYPLLRVFFLLPLSNAFIFQVGEGGQSNLIYSSSGNQKIMHVHFNQMMSL